MKYTITQGELAVCIDAAGAQLTSVTWKGREYLWQGDPAYWPDVPAMTRELHEMGVRLAVSVWPTINENSENYAEMKEKGLLK